ncbi:SMI1/KNR4 family protein [Chitinophaga caseinilytica]|uniref:SMI1/KNR4 family protein n=1 Tax=Chitinophaga caseinilytica TaxID=2267521 RepID=A0ABZ2ZCM4_9BACT
MTYKPLIHQLFSLPDQPQGYEETDIAAAEARLGCRLPAVLRDYYRTMGRFEALNTAFNRLLPPEKLYLSDSGMLVFYTENQDVVIWGIDHEDFGKPDPAVYGSYDADREEWLLDADTMEHFLWSMAYVQAGMGGLAHLAFAEGLTEATMLQLENEWTEVKGITHQYYRFFLQNNTAIALVPTNDKGAPLCVYLASNDDKLHGQLLKSIPLNWDASL